MKNLLIVAYSFPPCGGVGTFRVTKFVKFMRAFNWEPIVITIKSKYYQVIDNDYLMGNIPKDIEIFRTKLNKFYFDNTYGFNWLFPLYKTIKEILKNKKIDVVYFTGGPCLPFIVGSFIKKKYHIPYILDFRDEWLLDPYRKQRKGIKKIIDLLIAVIVEPLVLKNAEKVIFANNTMKNHYSDYYKKNKALLSKFFSIDNGYDPDDYDNISPKIFDKFTVVYTGKFLEYRKPDLFLRVLKRLINEGIELQFIHVGKKEEELIQKAKEFDLENYVVSTGFLSHKECNEYAKGADLLLLIGGESDTEQTGKIFDYIGCMRPILALSRKDGEIAKIIDNYGNGYLFENISNNEDKVFNFLKLLITDKAKTNIANSKIQKLNKYERRELTKQLANILDSIVK